jgi:uncharacterized protein
MHGILLAVAIAGYWKGSVTAGNATVQVAVEISSSGRATLDAPATGYLDQALKVVSSAPEHLRFELPTDDANVIAEAAVEGDEMRGTVTIGSSRLPLVLHRAQKPRPPYLTETATIRNGEVTLGATLYLPRSGVPMPGIVFVAGIVARGGDIHFLADQFASRGIAVLTYDRRGLGTSTGDPRAGFVSHASDAAAAVRFLRARKDIDASRVGIRGQSQGAWIAPLAATQVPVAFVIATAGGSVQPWESETYAVPARMRSHGFTEAEVAEASRYMEMLFEVGRTGKGWQELAAKMDGLRASGARWFGRYGSVPPSLERLRATWEREFSYDPIPALEKLKVPLLAMSGEKDVYSPAAESLRAIAAHAGSADKTLKLIPEATHDFRVLRGPLPTVSDEYLNTMLQWTEAHTGKSPSPPAANRAVTGNRIVSREPRLTVEVDVALKYVGAFDFDIRDAARGERILFADADASGNIRRLFVVQFEAMVPAHRGSYDLKSSNPARLGPYDFNEVVGRYEFAAAIRAKPGAEAERTRDFLAQKGLHADAPLVVARYETTTDRERRSEMLVFYWEDATIAGIEGLTERAKSVFKIGVE